MQNDEKAIRELLEKWMAASRAGDTATVLSLMSDDVVFMVPGLEPFGKQAFANNSEKLKNVRLDGTADIQELQVLGDWAWMRTRLRVTITPPNSMPMVRAGYTLTILRKQSDGRWLLCRDANLLTEESHH